MSVTEADPATAIKPLINGDHDNDSIVKNEAYDASILSKDTQDLKHTLVDTTNDTLPSDLIAKPVESVSEVLQPQISSVAIPSNSNIESHVELSLSHSIVNGVSDMNTTDGSILTSTTASTDSVPPNKEHQEVAPQATYFEESLQEPANPTTTEPLTTEQHGNADTEEKLIDGVNAASSASAIKDALLTDKDSTVHHEVNSSMAAEETRANADKSTALTSDDSPAVAPPDLPVALADVAADIVPEALSSSQVDISAIGDAAPLVLENTHASAMAEHPVAPAADEEFAQSDSAEIVAEVPTAEAEQEEQAEASTTSLTLESTEPSAAVEVSVHAADHAEETAPITSGNTEPIVVEENSAELLVMEDIPSATVEPSAEHVTEINEGEVSTPLHELTTTIELGLVEIPTSTANDVEDDVQPNDTVDSGPAVVAAMDGVEANGRATDNSAEPEDANPAVDAPALDADDTTSESAAEVVETDHVERTDVTAFPTTEIKSVKDATPVGDTVEHAPVTETTSPKEAVDDVPVGNDEAGEPSESDPTTAEEVSVPTPETEDEDDAETEDPKPSVDAPAPDAYDITISESVTEPAEVHETDHVEPTTVTAVLTTEIEPVEDAAPVGDTAEHASVTEATEGVAVGDDEVEPFESDSITAEEVSVPALEMAEEDDAAVHTHIEAAALMMDDEPADSELLQSVESTVEPVDIPQDATRADNCEVIEAAHPIISDVSAPEEDIALSAISEAQRALDSTSVESLVEDVMIEEDGPAEELTTDIEAQGVLQEPPIVEEAVVQELEVQEAQEATSAVPQAVDGLPPSEQDGHPQEQPAAVIGSDLPSEEAKPSEVDTVAEVVEENIFETGAEETSDDQIAITKPAAEENVSEEAPVPAVEAAVEQGVPPVTIEPTQEARAVEEIVIAAEPTDASAEIILVETVSTRNDTKDTIAAETEPSLFDDEVPPVEPSSSEQPESVDVHADAKAIDEELLVHEEAETAEIQEPVDAETAAIDVIPADGLMEEESIHTQGERVVEEPAIEYTSITIAEEESVETGAAEEVVKEAVPSIEDAPVLESSTDTVPNQDADVETKVFEEIQSTPEEHATEDIPVVEEAPEPPVRIVPVVQEEESQPVANDDMTSTQGEPLSDDQPILEETLPVVASLDREIPPVEATEELNGTPQTTVPVGEVETVEEVIKEDIRPAVVEEDTATAAESQQTCVEHSELEEVPFAAQEPPISPEVVDKDVSIPDVQETTSPDASIQEIDASKDFDEPNTFVEAVTRNQSAVDPTLVEDSPSSAGDLLKTVETEVERPKSPWMPSFQVTTVGRGVSTSTEDEQPESQESTAVPVALVNDLVPDEILEVAVPAVKQALDSTSQIEHPTPQLLVDTPSLDSSVEPARPWTPSYSVHSQGSPLHKLGDLDQEDPALLREADDQVLAVGVPELPEMKFANNEGISVSNILGSSEPVTAHEIDSAEKSAEPFADTDVADVAVVEDVLPNSDLEEQVAAREVALEEPEVSVEADMSSHAVEETQDVNYGVPEIPKLILNDFTEAPAQVEEDQALLILPSENLQEQSSSLSWVPSYSVSRQGSPLQGNVELPEEESLDIPDQDDIPLVDNSSDDLTDPQASVEDAAKPQTPNEEVGNRSEPAIPVGSTLQDFTVEDTNNTVQVDNSVDSKVNLAVVVDDGENRAQMYEEELSHAVSKEDSADRPRSPWTPSYSVTMQGPEMTAEGHELEFEPLARRDVIIQEVNIDRSDISEPEKTIIQPKEGSVDLTVTEEELLEHDQYMSFLVETDAGSTNVAAQEPVSSVESVAEQIENQSKPQVPRLELVDEHEKADATFAEEVSPTTRKRLESTASSRFFPGGWFSATSKVVDEGRTSLEIAQGEFTSSKPMSPANDPPDSPVSEDASITTDEDDDESEQEKRRWCVVM